MVITHKKLQPMQCYHIFSDTRDVYLSKNHYGSYSPQMVPTNPPDSWPITVTLSRRVMGCIQARHEPPERRVELWDAPLVEERVDHRIGDECQEDDLLQNSR